MRNGDVQATWTYHDATKHSLERVQRAPHHLDWDNQPTPYKLYPTLAPAPLPRDWRPAPMPALAALARGAGATAPAPRVPTAAELARLLLLTAGITRKVVYANGHETYFRAAACTGALYHVDVYVVCGALAGLDAGVYHFGPHDFSLRRLRAGDHRAAVVAASGDEPAVAAAAVVLISASTVWRNAWKYQARAYRHCFWDDGTMLANALAAAAAVDLPARVVMGFVDDAIARLVGLEHPRELPLSLLAVGVDPAPRPPAPELGPLAAPVEPPSARETSYPAIAAMHDASALRSSDEVRAWREGAVASAIEPAPRADVAVPLRPLAAPPEEPLDAVIRRRGSTRAFARRAIGFDVLSSILVAATAPLDADFLADASAHLCELFVIAHAVDGLAAGTYVHDRDARSLELLRAGDLRREAGFLALGQDLAADASADCYGLVDLTRVLAALGNRGYRCAQLEAAIAGGRIYLAAYALGLGATGLTFFDDAVVDFFGPRAAGKSVMFLAALGHVRPRARQ